MTAQALSKEVQALDGIRPKPAKVTLPVHDSPTGLSKVVRAGLLKACGSMKAAAITMGIDQSQLNRELDEGTFKLKWLEKLSDSERAVIVEELHAEFASLLNPKGQILRALDDIEMRARLVRQYVEAFA